MSEVLCEDCGAKDLDHCACEDESPQTYRELRVEADRRTRKANKNEEFKSKIRSVTFKRVKGGGRD